MRVALDATPLRLSSGGLRRYTEELTYALLRNHVGDQYALVSDQPWETAIECEQLSTYVGAGPLASKWWSVGLPRYLQQWKADVFHGTNFAVPYMPLRASVMTLHDLSPWREPAWHKGGGADRVRRRTPALLKMRVPTTVITVSEAIRRETIDHFQFPPERVVAVPLAAARHLQPQPLQPTGRPYFLFVGTLEPRKNLPSLVEAWRWVRKTHDVDLVVAGRARDDAPPLPELPGLWRLGEVPEAELAALYSYCVAFVYPSLYEGFGLPVLEAMQCGAPVITSRDPAISEVAGEAAIRVEARDTGALVESMLALLRHQQVRECFRAKSLARARCFSWDETARRTREVYIEALQRFAA
jgi:glycosyltransferase involved in cell wall biosynthesis